MIAPHGGRPWRPREVVLSARAARDLRKLPHDAARRILAALSRYAETGVGDVVTLTDSSPPVRRLRVGDFRVFLGTGTPDAPDSLPVIAVRNRREAY